MKKQWLGCEVIFSKENNILKIVMTSKIYLKLIVVSCKGLFVFTDDTNLFLSNQNIGELFHQMNKELKSVSTWFKENKLSINIDKTK